MVIKRQEEIAKDESLFFKIIQLSNQTRVTDSNIPAEFHGPSISAILEPWTCYS